MIKSSYQTKLEEQRHALNPIITESLRKSIHPYRQTPASFTTRMCRNLQPIVLVDWSGLSHCGKYHFLCASVPVGGRALPVLEMAFEEKEYGSQKAHTLFLTTLADILPKQCQPIVITDAGFRCPWFKQVQCSVSLKHAKRGNEPWLLASSLSNTKHTVKHIVNLYKKRMQIEQAFRDLKNTRNGFGFRHCRAQNVKRFEVALLIAALAMFLLWLIGRVKKEDNSHFSYQANTVKSRNVLSCFSIGWQVLKRGELHFLSWRQLLLALESFAVLEGGI